MLFLKKFNFYKKLQSFKTFYLNKKNKSILQEIDIDSYVQNWILQNRVFVSPFNLKRFGFPYKIKMLI